ncbi:hypothetical protein V8E36_001367 [Tilletia maclaganii]
MPSKHNPQPSTKSQASAHDDQDPKETPVGDIKATSFARPKWASMESALDGVRAMRNGIDLISKSGRTILAPQWFLEEHIVLDGELWAGREKADFHFVNGLSRRQYIRDENKWHREWARTRFAVFDIPFSRGGIKERLQTVTGLLEMKDPEVALLTSASAFVVPYTTVSGMRQADRLAKHFGTKQGEGVVLKNSDAGYERGWTTTWLKWYAPGREGTPT